MNKISVASLQPGSYFSGPTYLDEKYILLSPETPVSEGLKKRLVQWGFNQILSDGHSTGENMPGTQIEETGTEAPLGAFASSVEEEQHMGKATEIFMDMTDFCEALFTHFVTREELPQRQIIEKIKVLIEFVKENQKYILRLGELNDESKSYIVVQSVKTTILAIAMGQYFKLPNHKLLDLASAALLHEIGMVRLPPQLYLTDKDLSPQEKKAITAHTVLGFKILRGFNFPMPVCLAVLESHENINGTGYPRGITGDKISTYAKIIAVCDNYAANVSKRPYREARDGHTTLMEMLKDGGKAFDENIIRALVYTISIFPLGSFVLLNSGAKGNVVESTPENPRTPTVKIIMNPHGERLKEPMLLKTEEGNNTIQRALTPEEVAELNS